MTALMFWVMLIGFERLCVFQLFYSQRISTFTTHEKLKQNTIPNNIHKLNENHF
ncbi:MAG: hypothetical protein JWP12_502 [Bacteroidetes bacterium]|nr:hypothetical protein [Bacteroidota bacterium]